MADDPAREPVHTRSHHVHHDVDDRVAAILDRLRGDGGRITATRRAIVSSLYTGDDHHVTAEDLAARLQPDHPDLALSTIYRTLDALEHIGVVARIDLGQASAVYHLVDHEHHHLVCEGCGSVIELDDAAIVPLAERIEDQHGFALSRQRLTLTGRCRSCQR